MSERTAWLSSWLGDGTDEAGVALSGIEGAAARGCERAWMCHWPHDAGAEVRAMRGTWLDLGSRYDRDRPCLRLRYKPTGRQITVMRTASWLGDGDYSHHQARRVMLRLADELWQTLRCPAMRTPAQVGLDTWQRGWGDKWPVLPRELQGLIRSTSGQGRFECCTPGDVEQIPALYLLDSLMRYPASALAVELGDEARHELAPQAGWADCAAASNERNALMVRGFLGYTPARYRVRFTVPANWGHVGLLPVYAGRGGWRWPIAGEWVTWADGIEVQLAIRHGCHVEVLERVVWTHSGGHSRRPLERWTRHLLEMHDRLVGEEGQDSAPGCDADLYHAAIRSIMIQTIGAFASRPRTVTRSVGEGEEVPDHRLAQDTTREAEDGRLEYDDYQMPSAAQQRTQHPEFAAAVWAYARRCLLWQRRRVDGQSYETGALTLPRENVVGFALDGIYTTHDPGWPYHGKLGEYRTKSCVQGPFVAPRSCGELQRLAKGGDE